MDTENSILVLHSQLLIKRLNIRLIHVKVGRMFMQIHVFANMAEEMGLRYVEICFAL